MGDVCHQILRVLGSRSSEIRSIQLRDPAAAILDFSGVAICRSVGDPVVDRLGIDHQVLGDGIPCCVKVVKGDLLIDRHRHCVGLFRVDGLAGVRVRTGGHRASPLLVSDEAVRKVPRLGRGELQVLVPEAQGEEHRLDPVPVQASALHLIVDLRHRTVQFLQTGLHDTYLGSVFRGHGRRNNAAVEHQVHGGVVVLSGAREQRQQQGGDEDDRGKDRCRDPSHGFSGLFICQGCQCSLNCRGSYCHLVPRPFWSLLLFLRHRSREGLQRRIHRELPAVPDLPQ